MDVAFPWLLIAGERGPDYINRKNKSTRDRELREKAEKRGKIWRALA
jgi:hypothetical protein